MRKRVAQIIEALSGRLASAAAKTRAGFTLPEIMVVLLIVTIGIVPLAVVQSQARREVGRSDRFTQAVALAQDRLERLKGAGFGVAAADSGQAGRLRWVSAVQNVGFGLDRITVTVTWRDGGDLQTVQVAGLQSMR
jgi:prepilin-type N-terminal cleavage/methylation domain-containing protein